MKRFATKTVLGPTLLGLTLLGLTACGTPQEQCISANTRDLRVVERLIRETEGNLARGYGYVTVTEYEAEWVDCTPDPSEANPNPTQQLCFDRVPVSVRGGEGKAVRAAAGPYGTTIAHGFLTLSLLPLMADSAIELGGVRMGVNYGLNKVRFMAPVPVGSRLRAHLHLHSATPIEGNGLQLQWNVTVEREGSDKPVCAAESLVRIYA